MNSCYDYLLKIVLIGSQGTGKTNFQSKICRNQFNIETQPTVGIEFGVRDVLIESHTIRFQIWDTAGQEKYLSLTPSYFRNAAGVFILYDVTKKDTFEYVQKWLQLCRQYVDSHTQIYLLGNKIDLVNLREVTRGQASSFAQANCISFGECSAATGENIDEVFIEMITNIYAVMMCNEVVVDNPSNRTSILSKRDNKVEQQCCV